METEIKLPVDDLAGIQSKILAFGFRLHRERTFESNLVLDTATQSLRSSGRLLRLRSAGGLLTATYKGPGVAGKHKVREELETEVNNIDTLAAIFQRLGYDVAFRYEKYRTEYEDGEGLLVVDETPIGNYLELEGVADWIDRRAAELNYREDQYITKSYGSLYKEYCLASGKIPRDMVFPEKPR